VERTYWFEPRIAPGGDILTADAAAYGLSMPERVQVDIDAEPNGFASIRQGSTFVRPPGVLRLDTRPARFVPMPNISEPAE